MLDNILVKSDIYTGTGSQHIFTYPFLTTADAQVLVMKLDTSVVPNAFTTLTDGVDYVLVAGAHDNESGGSVNITVAPLTTEKIIIHRVNPLTQTTDWANQRDYAPQAIEARLDLTTKMIQELDEKVARSIKLPEFSNTVDTKTQVPSAEYFMQMNTAGDGIDWVESPSGGVGTSSLARIAGSTYSTIQDMQNLFHSTGISTGGVISDGGGGTLDVSVGTGFIRATDSDAAELLFANIPSATGMVLTNMSMNYIYCEYNSGTPQLVATTTQRTDLNTNIYLGSAHREGTTLHVTVGTSAHVANHAALMFRRMNETTPFQRTTDGGGIISETGTRNLAISAADWWEGIHEFSTTALDTAVADTYSYYYQDTPSGWVTVASQTTVDNDKYEDGSGTPAVLGTAKYGVRWVYLAQDNDFYVVLGTSNGNLNDAFDEGAPATTPPHFAENHARLVGKVIIQKGASVFTSIESALDTQLGLSTATDHGALAGLDGDDHPQYALLAASSNVFDGDIQIGGAKVHATSQSLFTITEGAGSGGDPNGTFGAEFVIDGAGSVGGTILCGVTQTASLFFGDSVDVISAALQYTASSHATLPDEFAVGTAKAGGVTKITSGNSVVGITLDAASDAIFAGDATAERVTANTFFNLGTEVQKVISGGVLTITSGSIRVATQAAAAADDLDTINGGVTNDVAVFRMAVTGQVPTFKDGTGNLRLNGDWAPASTDSRLVLQTNGTNWFELSRTP